MVIQGKTFNRTQKWQIAPNLVTQTVTGFRVFINLGLLEADDLFWDIYDSKPVIWATDSTGQRIALYVHRLDVDTSSGYLSVWMPGYYFEQTGATINLWFDTPDAEMPANDAPYGRNSVFPDVFEFIDFQELPTGSAPQLTSLSGSSPTYTKQLVNPSTVNGPIGQGWAIPNSNLSQRLQGQRSGYPVIGEGVIAVGIWVNFTVNQPQVFDGRGLGLPYSDSPDGPDVGWQIRIDDNRPQWRIRGNDGSTFIVQAETSDNLQGTGWRYIVGVLRSRTDGGLEIYLDGNLAATANAARLADVNIVSLRNPCLGSRNNQDGTYRWRYVGSMWGAWSAFDTLPSPESIKLHFLNISDPGTFWVSIPSTQVAPGPPATTIPDSIAEAAYLALLEPRPGYGSPYQLFVEIQYITGCRPEELMDISLWSTEEVDTTWYATLQPFKGNNKRFIPFSELPQYWLDAIEGGYLPWSPLSYSQLRAYFNRQFQFPMIAIGERQIAHVLARYLLAKRLDALGWTLTEITDYFGWHSEGIAGGYIGGIFMSSPG